MSYILHIDTATETAHVSLAENGRLLRVLINEQQKDHAAFVQKAIQELLQDAEVPLHSLDAIAVTAGPGSYTGLRVGMASAKGLCYALQKPFIAIGTLEVMTKAALLQNRDVNNLYCPMIDARRMEVFTAVYDADLNVQQEPCALILDEKSYSRYAEKSTLVFFGSGAAKWKAITQQPNVLFTAVSCLPEAFSALSYQYYKENKLSSLAYTEPYYIKDFRTNI